MLQINLKQIPDILREKFELFSTESRLNDNHSKIPCAHAANLSKRLEATSASIIGSPESTIDVFALHTKLAINTVGSGKC